MAILDPAIYGQCSGRVDWENRLVLATGRQISTFGEDETGELYLADYRGDIYLIAAGPPVTSAGGVVNAEASPDCPPVHSAQFSDEG